MKYLLTLLLISFTSATALAAGSGDHGHDSGHSQANGHGHDGGHGQGGGHGHGEFAVGAPASGTPDRVIEVSMLDTMRFEFEPEFNDLHAGEVIRFEVRNDGKIVHEFSIGNAEEQKKHAEMMRQMPNMKHVDPNTVSLEPGDSESLTWRFEGDDKVIFACNVPGHFEAGMHHDLAISKAH